MKDGRGWYYESQRHALAARGIPSSQGIPRVFRRTPRPPPIFDEYLDLRDLTFRYMAENNWSRKHALADLDEDYRRLRFVYRESRDPNDLEEMNINRKVRKIIKSTSITEIKDWPPGGW